LFCFFKEAKREDRLQKEADDRVRKKASIDIPLLPSNRQDDRLAKLYRLEPIRCKSKKFYLIKFSFFCFKF
jgi:hypothetical protein